MREAYRLNKKPLSDSLQMHSTFMAFFFIYIGNTVPKYHQVSDKISLALKKLEKIADENTASTS